MSSVFSSLNVWICSLSVFALQRLIKINSESSVNVSKIKILPFLSHRRFFTVNVLLPEKPVSTPHEFDLPCEQYKSPSNLSFLLILFSFLECVSCKNIMTLENVLFWINSIDVWKLLTLLHKKLKFIGSIVLI